MALKSSTTKKTINKKVNLHIPDKTTLNNSQKREYAFDMFINTDYTQKQIAEFVGVTEKTIGKWKEINNWDQLKSAQTITSQKIIRSIYKRMTELTEAGQNLEADKLIKLAKTIESLSNNKVTISQTINVLKEFTSFLYNNNPQMAKEVNIQMQKFVNNLIQ